MLTPPVLGGRVGRPQNRYFDPESLGSVWSGTISFGEMDVSPHQNL